MRLIIGLPVPGQIVGRVCPAAMMITRMERRFLVEAARGRLSPGTGCEPALVNAAKLAALPGGAPG